MLSPGAQAGSASFWHKAKTPAVVALAFLLGTLVIASQAFRSHHHTQAGTDGQQQQTSNSMPAVLGAQRELPTGPFKEHPLDSSVVIGGVNATGKVETLLGSEVLIVNVTTPKAILLIFHGCSHSATDFWYPSAACPQCLGLPEQLAVMKEAVQRSFAVVAISSIDRESHRCWDANLSPDTSSDVIQVLKVWKVLSEREGWTRIPHYGLGGSSGGAFVLFLAQRLPLDGVCVEIMGVSPQLLETKPRAPDSSRSWAHPPVYFVHMEQDEFTAEAVAADIAVLKKQGIPVAEEIISPRPLSPTFFSSRIDEVDTVSSLVMFNALREAEIINGTGYLTDNPRSPVFMRRWQKALHDNGPTLISSMSLAKDESPIFEELNVAFAQHELVSDPVGDILDWFQHKTDGPKLLSVVNPRRLLRAV